MSNERRGESVHAWPDKRGIMLLAFMLFFVLIINFAAASFSAGNPAYSIEKKYGISQGITGWINMSVKNESSNALIKDSLNNQISLMDLLKLNLNANYSCSPSDCKDYYSTSNGQTSKQMTNTSGSSYYGILFSGEIKSINLISFDINALNVPSSCSSQFNIDIFDDGIIDAQNTLASNDICPGSRTYGCYNNSVSSEEYILDSGTMYCQKLTLPVAPGFRLGAWVKKESGSKDVQMSLYKEDGSLVDNGICNLPDASSSGSEIYCDVNYSVKDADNYSICISSDSGEGSYKIKGYDFSNGCGFFGQPPADILSSAYDIFAEAKKFASLNAATIPISNDLSTGESLNTLAENYITKKNGNLSCSKGCLIPVKFTANSSAELLGLNNLRTSYEKSSGIVTGNSFYDLMITPSKVNLSYGKLYLDGSGLKVKNTAGSLTYTLKFNNQKIFSDTLTIQKGPEIKGLAPRITTYAFPTNFKLNVVPAENISTYTWDFGDNKTDTTTINRVSHTYSESGLYNLKITVKDIKNIISSSNFQINVTSPVLLINKTIAKMKSDIADVKSQLDSYDLFYRTSLSDMLNANNLSLEVTALEDRYKKGNESDYSNIALALADLKIPESIVISESAPRYVFYPAENNVNVDVVKEIEQGGNESGSNDDYVKSIYSWNAENIKNSLNYEEYSAEYPGESDPLLKVFTFTISEKNTLNYNSYLIIKDMENLKFKDNYGQKDVDGYNYITLTGATNTITFSTTEDVNFENVPAFISPGLSELSLVSGGEIPNETPSTFPTMTFIWILLIVLAVGAAAYFALNYWYKRKYEGNLFRNRNDLYNLLHFIDSQRKKGVNETEIHQKLKKTGWNSEQIRYATRKHSGKTTGMPGLPIWII